MYKGKKILGIIPARGGSKGIPSKNIIEIYGKPLIQYSIECANSSKYLDRTVISTNKSCGRKIWWRCSFYEACRVSSRHI